MMNLGYLGLSHIDIQTNSDAGLVGQCDRAQRVDIFSFQNPLRLHKQLCQTVSINIMIEQECIPIGCVPPAHLPYLGGVCLGGWVSAWVGVSCGLSHHTFDVTCMLSLLQLRMKSNAAAYIVLVMWPDKECWNTPPPCGQNSWHTLVKTLPSRNYCCER